MFGYSLYCCMQGKLLKTFTRLIASLYGLFLVTKRSVTGVGRTFRNGCTRVETRHSLSFATTTMSNIALIH